MQSTNRKWYNGINTNAFRYCGEYYDSETGTIYLRARHYNPSNGRFTQRDSFAGKQGDPLSLNLYTYCHNNPILHWDPSGHNVWTSFVDGFVDNWKLGSSEFRDNWKMGIGELQDSGTAGRLFASYSMGVTDAGGAMGSSVVGIVRNPIKSASNLAKDYASYGKNDWKNWNPAWYFGTKTGEGLVDQAVSSYNLGAEYGAEGFMYALGQSTTIVAQTGVSAYGSQMLADKLAMKNTVPGNKDMMYVTRYGRPGLEAGDWIMPGKNTWWNYIRSFKWQKGFGNQFAPKSSGQTFTVPKNTVKWPTGFSITDGAYKGLFGQRIYQP